MFSLFADILMFISFLSLFFILYNNYFFKFYNFERINNALSKTMQYLKTTYSGYNFYLEYNKTITKNTKQIIWYSLSATWTNKTNIITDFSKLIVENLNLKNKTILLNQIQTQNSWDLILKYINSFNFWRLIFNKSKGYAKIIFLDFSNIKIWPW